MNAIYDHNVLGRFYDVEKFLQSVTHKMNPEIWSKVFLYLDVQCYPQWICTPFLRNSFHSLSRLTFLNSLLPNVGTVA